MSIKPLQRLIDLVEFDREVLALEQSLTSFEKEISSHIIASSHAKDLIKEAKQRIVTATKAVDDAELELKILDDALKDKKQRFDKAANMTEYRALKNEIDALMDQQHEVEESVAEAWTRLENTQKDAEQLEDAQLVIIEEADIQVKARENELQQLKERIVEKALLRAELEKLVPEEWRDRYIMMRKRVSDPVVPTVNGACGACFYMLPNQDLMRLRRGAVLVCNSCYRLLFDPTSPVHQDNGEGA